MAWTISQTKMIQQLIKYSGIHSVVWIPSPNPNNVVITELQPECYINNNTYNVQMCQCCSSLTSTSLSAKRKRKKNNSENVDGKSHIGIGGFSAKNWLRSCIFYYLSHRFYEHSFLMRLENMIFGHRILQLEVAHSYKYSLLHNIQYNIYRIFSIKHQCTKQP